MTDLLLRLALSLASIAAVIAAAKLAHRCLGVVAVSLLDRIVPASALRWGALTRPWPPLEALAGAVDRLDLSTLDLSDGLVAGEFRRAYLPIAGPDPAALWGEHDRQAEDRP